jgi:hypothetical protein
MLSRDLSHLAWIALSVKMISYWKILNLSSESCESCVAGHVLCRLIGVYPAFSWWYSELIWIFVLFDLVLASLRRAFFLAYCWGRVVVILISAVFIVEWLRRQRPGDSDGEDGNGEDEGEVVV